MFLYLVKRTDGCDYDEYDGVVLRAKTKDRALEIATGDIVYGTPRYEGFDDNGSNLAIACIGKANPFVKSSEGEVLASFNAG